MNSQIPRDFLIDTDTASDDAVALIMALRSREIVVHGITVVAGNVSVEQATRNALFVTELCQCDVPVYAGCTRPILRKPANASWFHGQDGLGDVGFAPTKDTTAETEHAVDAMRRITAEHPGLTLVTLGPLTNVAVALLRDPAMAQRIGRCVIMGGNPCCVGNVTPAAEYNIWCDPEAAEIVLRSGMPCELVGWHLCRGEAVFNTDNIATVLAIDTRIAKFAIDCNRTAAEAYRTQTGEPDLAARSNRDGGGIGSRRGDFGQRSSHSHRMPK